MERTLPANAQHSQAALLPAREHLVLVLRPQPPPQQVHHVTWDAGVRDTTGQRSSKKCCVFHKKRLFGESDSEDDSSSSSCSSSDDDAEVPQNGGCAHANPSSPPQATDHAPPADQAPQPPGHRHPRCTKDACFCGTRFA